MTQAHRIYCVLAAAAMLAVQGPAQGADVNQRHAIPFGGLAAGGLFAYQ